MWILSAEKRIVGGRNSYYDPWGSEELNDMLMANDDAFKLRRHANSIFKEQK